MDDGCLPGRSFEAPLHVLGMRPVSREAVQALPHRLKSGFSHYAMLTK